MCEIIISLSIRTLSYEVIQIKMIFNTSISCFHENSFHYFIDYLMMKLTLGKVVR
jgi:hypothetical protein